MAYRKKRAAGRAKAKPVAPVGSARPCNSDLVGKDLPGRRSGKIVACAVPPRATPRATYLFVHPKGALPGGGFSIKSSRVRRRLRNRTIEMYSLERAYLDAAHNDFRQTGIPAPTGVEFPHRRGASRCDPEHSVWAGYEEARSDAAERASIETEGQPDEVFIAVVRELLSKHPSWETWLATAKKCARDFEERAERRKPKGGAQYERAQIRRRMKDAGDAADERDILGGDYLSEALDATTDPYKRRAKRSSRRVRTHRAG